MLDPNLSADIIDFRIKRGDLLVFKRGGILANVLGAVLKVICPRWDGWGWHTAVVIGHVFSGYEILESLGGGVCRSTIDDSRLGKDIRAYRILAFEPSIEEVERTSKVFFGCPYDVLVYFWTSIALLLRHFWNRRIPKLLDNRFTCWELAEEWYWHFGTFIVSKYDIITIVEIMDNFQHRRIR